MAPPTGVFTDRDPSELVDLLDRKVLASGIVGRMMRSIDGVVVRPVSDDAESQATISRPGLFGKSPIVFVQPPGDMTQDQARSLITAAGLEASNVRKSSGMYAYEFDVGTPPAQIVTFVLGALRAVGARPPDDRWRYEGTEPQSA